MVCAECLLPGNYPHSLELMRCAKCKILQYCSKDCQTKNWPEHKKRCRPGRLKPDRYSDSRSERDSRQRWVTEMEASLDFIRCHRYPSYQQASALLRRQIHLAYTEELHVRCEELYSFIGKNTYKVYGREFGDYIYNLGGMDALRESLSIMSLVIQSFPPDGIGSPAIAEVNARRLLSSSWDGIGSWMD